jgi:Winged helix-turn helix
MRYPDGGGLSTRGRARREKLRLQAAQMFEQGIEPVQAARCLRVSAKSAALDLGPAVCGWGEDQRWTLARVTALMARLFHAHYTLRGTSYLLHRMGFSPQVPVHRAAERDEAVIAAWRTGTWAKEPAQAHLVPARTHQTGSSPRLGSPSNPNRPSVVSR